GLSLGLRAFSLLPRSRFSDVDGDDAGCAGPFGAAPFCGTTIPGASELSMVKPVSTGAGAGAGVGASTFGSGAAFGSGRAEANSGLGFTGFGFPGFSCSTFFSSPPTATVVARRLAWLDTRNA